MSGWWWAGGAVTVMVAAAVLMSLALRHGERQARTARAARQSRPHAASWGTEQPHPKPARTARQAPAWARADHHNGRHRR